MNTSTNQKRRWGSGDSITEREEEKIQGKKKKCHQRQFHNHKKSNSPSTLRKLYQHHPHMPHHLIPLKPSKPPSTQRCPPSPLSSPKLSSWSLSETKHHRPTEIPQTQQRAKSVSKEDRQELNANYFCTDIDQPNIDHQIKKSLMPLRSLKSVNNKMISNPYLFRGAPMVTTFVRLSSNRTKELWQFIAGASRVDMRLAEMEHYSLKKMLTHCAGRVPIYVCLNFYRSLKLRYPLDVGGISRDGRVTTELGIGSLCQAVGIFTPEDFRTVVNTE